MIVYVFKRKALMVLLWQNFPIYFTKRTDLDDESRVNHLEASLDAKKFSSFFSF